MKIFLTGKSGFIGRNLLEALATDHDIIAPSHRELELSDEDAVRDFMQNYRFDAVIHCAVKPGHRNAADHDQLVSQNTRMFFSIARNLSAQQVMINIGSGSEYDMRHYQPRMKEEYFDAHIPVDDSAFAKYIIAKHIDQTTNIINLRVFGVFGKYEDYAIRFISNAICKALCGLPITLRQDRRFDYLFIDDLIPVVRHFLTMPVRYRTYNVTPDESVTLRELAEIVRKLSHDSVRVIVAQEGTGSEYTGDNARLRREMPELRFTPVQKSVAALYSWYETNKQLIDKTRLLTDK